MGRADRIAPAEGVKTEKLDSVGLLHVLPAASGALTAKLRREILMAFKMLRADPEVASVIILGTQAIFASGTSLELDVDDPEVTSLVELCDAIEASDKPVVAAFTGAAIGNGLELVLAAHFRLVTPSTRLGAPEVTLGLVPRAGGTQRLPKLIGGPAALRMLLSGRAINGASAAKLGLADSVVDTDLRDSAIEFAKSIIEANPTLMRNSVRRDRLGDSAGFLETVAQHKVAAKRSGLDAPIRLIECVEAALLLPYEIGCGLEAAAFDDLVNSDQSRALRHVVSAERRLQARTSEIGRVPSRPLASVGVLAARGLGNEVAVAALDAGFSVTVAERTDEALEAGVTRIIEHYDARVAAGRMREDAVEATLDRMHAVCGYRTLDNVDIVVDPGPSIARARVGEIDAVLKAGAIFATGSEHVDLNRIAASTGRPSDVIGLKMYPGILKNRVVELSTLDVTSPRAKETARAFARKLGRMIVETGPSARGIGARLADALHAAADTAVIEGAEIARVDDVLRGWGIPLGSFAWRDAQGLERALRDRQAGEVDTRLAASGRTGRAVGRGFYSYAQRGQAGTEDPDVLAIIEDMRRELGITPSRLRNEQIRLACLAAMAGAGAAMLLDGTARRPSDIDMVAVHGLGFARKTGGVMYAADLVGLKTIRDLLARFSSEDGRIDPVSPIFADLIRANKRFSDLND